MIKSSLVTALFCAIMFTGVAANYANKSPLPAPTGTFPVGRSQRVLVDAQRTEWHNPVAVDEPRKVLITIFYPAELRGEETPLSYVSPAICSYCTALKQVHAWMAPLGYIETEFPTNSYENAVCSSKADAYPVLLFSHGFTAPFYLYTSLLEDLASHGYVIVAISHTYSSDPVEFPDGKITGLSPLWISLLHNGSAEAIDKAATQEIGTWLEDVRFVLDHVEQLHTNDPLGIFTGKLDLESIGMFGHSFGGGTAMQFGALDERCKAVANMDGPMYGEFPAEKDLKVPYLFLLGEVFSDEYAPSQEKIQASGRSREEYDAWITQRWREPVAYVQEINNNAVHVVLYPHAEHLCFSDFYYLQGPAKNSVIAPGYCEWLTTALRDDLLAFFNRYLNKDSTHQAYHDAMLKFFIQKTEQDAEQGASVRAPRSITNRTYNRAMARVG